MDSKDKFEDNNLSDRQVRKELSYDDDSAFIYKRDYQIAICQDGKFAVTFDTGNLQIRIWENTDHRPFGKQKNNIEAASQQNYDESGEIIKTVAYFKINDKLDIDHLYEANHIPQLFNAQEDSSSTEIKIEQKINYSSGYSSAGTTKNKEKQRWSLGISNIQRKTSRERSRRGQKEECSIYVAVSRIGDEDMKGEKDVKGEKDENHEKGKLKKQEYSIKNQKETTIKIDETKHIEIDKPSETKGIAIYHLKLKEKEGNYDLSNVTSYYSNCVSGICRFIKEDSDEDSNLNENNVEHGVSRFIVLNIHGIYNYNCDDNFNLNKKFDYPKSIKDELEYYHKKKDCMDKLLTCLYNQYFLVAQYENDVQILEVYSLAAMEVKTTARRVEEKIKHNRKYNQSTFSIGKLQLCFTQGLNSIKLCLMENGLETALQKIDGIEKIHALEFINSDEKLLIIGEDQKEALKLIILDLYTTGKIVEPISHDNFLTIKDLTTHLARTSGNLLKVIDKGKVTSVLKKVEIELKHNKKDKKSNLKPYKVCKQLSENHNIYFDKSFTNFKSIVDEKEPWVVDDYENYERNSYCLKVTETETLQLIVSRSTVQIWHQIHSDLDDKDLPNKGKPFLEYIWTNNIPIYQERKETRLRIEEMKHEYGSNDFYLKVYWYERDLKRNKEVNEKIKKINEEIKDKKENKEAVEALMKKSRRHRR